MNKTYKNKTYCTYNLCAKWKKCREALTQKISISILHWWKGRKNKPNGGAPVYIYSSRPDCYVKKEKTMLCYKDKTFCECKSCKEWNNCELALTKNIKILANAWWSTFKSNDPVPISIHIGKPNCFEQKK